MFGIFVLCTSKHLGYFRHLQYVTLNERPYFLYYKCLPAPFQPTCWFSSAPCRLSATVQYVRGNRPCAKGAPFIRNLRTLCDLFVMSTEHVRYNTNPAVDTVLSKQLNSESSRPTDVLNMQSLWNRMSLPTVSIRKHRDYSKSGWSLLFNDVCVVSICLFLP